MKKRSPTPPRHQRRGNRGIPCRFSLESLATYPLVGSIEGRVGVHHLDDAQQSKNFTFKCHREGNEIYSVNSLNFHPVRFYIAIAIVLVHHTFATAGSDGAFNFWDKDSKQRLKSHKVRDVLHKRETFIPDEFPKPHTTSIFHSKLKIPCPTHDSLPNTPELSHLIRTSLCLSDSVLSDFQAMSRCSQPIPCSTFNNDGSIFAYSVCYDWSKGAENHNPATAKTYIFLHLPQEAEVKGKPRIGTSGRK
ncbi:Protein RAE1 [Vitis vinifera]|uniref:Protein RAE1 n=1 Tax=Vitis vinifera TaxID=29760 RepID=A0A438J0L0_VITVI|nr:Protein RAE1 [Vitis vinifera]